MSNVKMKLAIAAVIAASAITTSAQATLTTYTNLAAFQAAAGTTTLEDFSSAALGYSNSNYSGTFNGFSLSSVSNNNLSGIANGTIANFGDNFLIPAAFNGQHFYGWGNGNAGGVGPTTTIDFGGPATALGFDWFNTDPNDTYSLTVNALTATALYDNVNGPASSGFFGIVATNGETFNSATIQTAHAGGYISTEGIDNLRVSTAATVPEPATLSILGLGLAVLGFSRRRKA